MCRGTWRALVERVILILPIKSGDRWAPVAPNDYATLLQGSNLPVGYRLKNLSNILHPIIASHATGEATDAITKFNLNAALHALGDDSYFEVGGSRQALNDEWLDLVIDINTNLMIGHRHFADGNDAESLDAYPAWELIPARIDDEPYDWQARWTESGGKKQGNRMLALKSDPVWLRISDFGHRHPPFAFESGMDVRDVSRVEAVEMALTGWRDEIQTVPCPICDG